ncbi:asparagine synthetase B family protein [Emticicia fontis]
MCRIIGVLNKKVSENLIVKMRDELSYGGPDDAGVFCNQSSGIGLGHRRLAIIDLTEAGHQPMFYKDLVIVFNGEIYNYQEVMLELQKEGYEFQSKSDTEVILKSFECWGYDCVNKFRGMFSFAIWNQKTEKLLLCRDRVGVKPLYWYYKDGLFMFASEIKAFHKHPDFDKTIDQRAVSLYLQTGYIKAPFSIFTYAHKLEPGAFLEVDKDFNIKTWKYWDVREKYNNTKLNTDSETDIINQCEDVLTESFQLRMVADVPVGVFLSGGIDSSLVTTLLQKESQVPLNTFTIGFEDKRFNEAVHAKNVAKTLGTNHTELYCKEKDFIDIIPQLSDMYDEPFGDSSGIPTFLVSQLARKYVTVSLSADGGDEIFTGYSRYLRTQNHYKKITSIPYPIRYAGGNLLDKLTMKQIERTANLIGNGFSNNLNIKLPRLIETLKAKNEIDFLYNSTSYMTPKELKEIHPLVEPIFNKDIALFNQRSYSSFGIVDIESYLEGDILTKIDRATMQIALEGREPFLDHKIIEFALGIPNHLKLRDGKGKWILRQILYKYLPKELIDRPKQGFAIPLDKWISTLLMKELLDLTNDKDFFELFSLNQSAITAIIKNYAIGKYQKPSFIWYIYILNQWYKHWLK